MIWPFFEVFLAQLIFVTTLASKSLNPLLARKKSTGLLNGKHLIVAANNWTPYITFKDKGNGTIEYSGFMYDALVFLSESLNFTYKIISSPDGKWGVGDENGNWNGMLGMVKRNEVDFALGPFGVIREREEACDFTFPVSIIYWTAVVPANMTQDAWSVVRPFSRRIWIALAIVTVIFWITLNLANKIYRGSTQYGKVTGFIFRTLLREPTYWYPHANYYSKVFSASWLVSIFVLLQGYSSVLMAMLTIPNVPVPINSVHELVSQNDIGWNVEEGSIMEQIGRSSPPGTVYHQMHKGATYGGTCYQVKDEIKAGKLGSVCDSLTINLMLSEDFTETGRCHFYVAEEMFLATPFAMAFQIGSSYLEEINSWILMMHQYGLHFHDSSLIKETPNTTYCDNIHKIIESRGSDNKKLTLIQTAGLFLPFLCGIAVSSLVFLIESSFIYVKNYFGVVTSWTGFFSKNGKSSLAVRVNGKLVKHYPMDE